MVPFLTFCSGRLLSTGPLSFALATILPPEPSLKFPMVPGGVEMDEVLSPVGMVCGRDYDGI